MTNLIKFKNVSKKYKTLKTETCALNNIDFTINTGEFVVILGPSGAGKSTLLNLLGGLDHLTSGEITVSGDNIESFDDNQLAEYRAKSVGFIFQFYNLLPTLNVLDNVNVVKEISNKGMDSKTILEKVGLSGKEKQYPAELSGGEQQRVSIARAVAKNTSILLCDEPTGALDTKTGRKIMDLLQLLNQNGKTVIVVTHNEEYVSFADKVIYLKDGQINKIEFQKKVKDNAI